MTSIIVGMTINLSTPNPSPTISRPTWNRYSVPRTPITPSQVNKKGHWDDFDDDTEVTPTTPSPTRSPPESMYHVNQSTGTLNMGIVI